MGALPLDLAERLWANSTMIRARNGQLVMSSGAKSSNVYIILEGRVQVTLFSLGGREVILRDLEPGALFGEVAAVDDGPRSASIVALTDCMLASVTAPAFRSAICELPSGAMWLARRFAAQIRDLTERVFELNALRVRSRLHCELLRMCGDMTGAGDRIVVEPSPTHAELASRVGTHREAVTREMRFLVRQGIIEQQRRRMTVVDPGALAQLVRLATGS